MSGLIGKLSLDSCERLARPVLEQMLDAPVHQGTNRHIFLAPGIALGVCGSDDLVPGGEHEFAPLRVAADATITNASALRPELDLRRVMRQQAGDGQLSGRRAAEHPLDNAVRKGA